MSETVYISQDSASIALGADDIASAIAISNQDVDIIRTGSRGMFWLEPMIEVETPEGRMGYGPVSVDDIGPLYDAGMLGEEIAGDWMPSWKTFQQDAGVGLTISMYDGRFFSANKPLVLRLDMPLWLSHPADGTESFAFRWIVGIGRAF